MGKNLFMRSANAAKEFYSNYNI